MNPAKIEYLIDEAIDNRPNATTAPVNLYIYNGKLVCGARVVMPQDAAFVTHVAPHQLRDGFAEKEWELIVRKIEKIAEAEGLEGRGAAKLRSIKYQSQRQIEANQPKFNERRAERRLCHRGPVLYARDLDEEPLEGTMVDVSSGGMAFTCRDGENRSSVGQQIGTRFSVPRFKSPDCFDTVSFNRVGRICRVSKASSLLHRIAVQFSKPLPFKPGEQNKGKSNAQQGLETTAV